MNKLLVFAAIAISAILSGCTSVSDNTTNSGANRSSSNTNQTINTGTSGAGNSTVNKTAAVQDNFWTNAAQGGMAEVEAGKLASTKATNPEVKKFAAMMVADHTKANDELKALAGKSNITLPAGIDASHKSVLDKLNSLSGADFDKAYVEGQVSDHEATVKLFEDQSKDDSNADLKAFAVKTLPTIKSHLETIKGIQSKMK